MQTDTLLQLADSGEVRGVEERWMALLASEDVSPDRVVELVPVLAALSQGGHQADAATLAWAAVETLSDRFEDPAVLRAAGQLLLGLPKSDELRQQVTNLYRRVYADLPAIDVLLKEAGIAGERPARRALRTLDVCLSVSVGSYLAARHDNSSARITEFDQDQWQFRVGTAGGEKELGALELADNYQTVDAEDYRVLRDFEPQRLAEKLEKDPVQIIVSILSAQGRTIDGDVLKDLLCPSLITQGRWAKWWAKTRTALKRCPNVDIEGRSPFYLTYRREGRTLEDETGQQFPKLHDPAKQLAAVQAYFRECKTRKQQPDRDLLNTLRDSLASRAKRHQAGSRALALTTRLIQRRVERELGETAAQDEAVALLASAPDPVECVRAVEVVSLWPEACECLELALPERRLELLADLLPVAPLTACDDTAKRLAAAGFTPEQFETMDQAILADPIQYHDALFWLWDGPSDSAVHCIPRLKLLTRMLWLLSEVRRREDVEKETTRRISTGARAVLSARKFEHFKACLEEVDPSMARMLRTQIRRLDNLGRVVYEDLLRLITGRFPKLEVVEKIERWADESVLWVTSSGMVRKQQEMEEHVNVTMKDNARRIGEAAAHGDLSENSEYKFALEERDLLRARLAQMQAQMGLAKVLTPEDVPTDRVGVGCRVVLKHVENDTTVELLLLGPWDSDISRHIYNYKTPFAQSLMGLTVGAQAEVAALEPQGCYEVVKIENGLI